MEAGLCHHSHWDEQIEQEKDKEDRKKEGCRQRGDAHQVEDG